MEKERERVEKVEQVCRVAERESILAQGVVSPKKERERACVRERAEEVGLSLAQLEWLLGLFVV